MLQQSTATAPPTTPSRVAIYCRVSSAGQEDNSSLPTQEESCRHYAAEHGYEIADVYRDVHTGADLFERPGLTALRDAVRSGTVNVVLAHALDRVGRDPDHLGFLFSEWDHAGARLELATERVDDSDTGKLVLAVHGYAAKLERLKITERTQRGKLARVRSGKPAVGPRPPFGYQWVSGLNARGKPVSVRLIENPETSPVIRRIFDELVAGVSTRQIAKRLSDDGIPTPTGLSQWPSCTIPKIAKNPAYCGQARAHRYQRERVKGQKVLRNGQWVDGKGYRYVFRNDAETIALPDAAPALVSVDVFEAVQARLARNQRESTRNNRNPEAALLRNGYAVCGYCGLHLSAHTSTDASVRYECAPRNRDHKGCPAFTMKATLLDAAIWQGVRDRLLDRNLIAHELERMRSEDPTGGDVARLDQHLATLERKQRNLMNRLADEDDADIAALIRADLQRLRGEQKSLDTERAALEQQRANWQHAQQRLSELDAWISRVSTNLDDLDYAGRRLALEACQVRVEVFTTAHSPRWHASMRLGGSAPLLFADTTTARCTRG